MSQRVFQSAEYLLMVLGLGLCFAQGDLSGPTVIGIAYGVVAVLLDLQKVTFPYYGFISVGPVLLLAAASAPQAKPGWFAIFLVILLLVRRRPTTDTLPVAVCLGLLAVAPAFGLWAGLCYFFLAVCHPLIRSRFFSRLPGQYAVRSWSFYLGCGATVATGPWLESLPAILCQVALLSGLMGLVRSQRGLNLESAQEQEAQRLHARRMKDWLRLLDTLAYSLHKQAQPKEVLSKVSGVLSRLSEADTLVLVRLSDSGPKVVSERQVGAEIAAEKVAQLDFEALSRSQATVLDKGWAGEAHALLLPWEQEALIYLGRREAPLQAIPLLERVARLGAAALDTSRKKAERRALGDQKEQLQELVDSLTSLLREVQFVGSTLDRSALLERLQKTLARTLSPDTVGVYSRQGLEQSWGSGCEALTQSQLAELPNHRTASSPISEHCLAVCVPLGGNRLFLSFREQKSLPETTLRYLAVLGDMVGTFLSNSELFSQLSEAHSELESSQSELVQAKKLAGIGQLAAGVAHEINNPLMAISVHLDNLKANLSDEYDLESADFIAQAVSRCQVIVSELLAFSRRPSGAPEAVDVRGLLREVQRTTGITVPVDCSSDLKVKGYHHELVRLFSNLLTNARDAVKEHQPDLAPEEGIRIAANAEGEQIVFSVSDKGPGISPELEERIFEPFYTTKEVGSGTGLGLYMVYSYVSNAKGEVSFQSEPGAGTTFHVRLPAAQEATTPDGAAAVVR